MPKTNKKCEYCGIISGQSIEITSGGYTTVDMINENDKFYIVGSGEDSTYTAPINFCPFCGRKLC